MCKKIVLILSISLLLIPSFSSAANVSNLQKLIESLLQQVKALQLQLAQQQNNSAPVALECLIIKNELKYRSRDILTNNEVSNLQDFLNNQNHLSSEPTGYFGLQTLNAVKKFQLANKIIQTGIIDLKTRDKIKEISCKSNSDQDNVISNDPLTNSSGGILNQNFNIGTIKVRTIVANIDEVGNKYGSYGMKFNQSKLAEVDQAMQRLNTFIKQSSYGKAQLQWTTSGVHELGKGVCSHTSYGDKVDDLIQRALTVADSQNPFTDYSAYLIVHPRPDCSDGIDWSYEGRGSFKAHTLNGRTVHLRGVHLSDLSDFYLFHEFGHSLGYKESIGESAYFSCPITKATKEVNITPSSGCSYLFDWNNGKIPVYTIMAGKPLIMSDYSAVEKEKIGWLSSSDVITTTNGNYTISPLEQNKVNLKVLKIPIQGTDFTVYVSFRQPIGYTYPNTDSNKPNGVILDIVKASRGGVSDFLVTDNFNIDAPLQVGTSYRVGNGPLITVNSISNNLASITISSNIAVSNPTPNTNQASPILSSPTCVLTTDKSSYKLGETIVYSWTSKNTTYASWQQDTSGKDSLLLSGDKLLANGSQQVTASIIGNPAVTLLVNGSGGTGSCSKVVSISENSAISSTQPSLFDQSTLRAVPNASFTLSGSVSAPNGPFTVAIIGPNYSGATDWNTVGNILKGNSSYIGVSKTISLSESSWIASFGGLSTEGYYTVFMYDNSYYLLGTATLWVTYKG